MGHETGEVELLSTFGSRDDHIGAIHAHAQKSRSLVRIGASVPG